MSFFKKPVFAVMIVSLLFFFLVGFNVSPYLRGPGEWPPDWRWPYLFVNTMDKVWLPLLIIFAIISLAYYSEKKKLDEWIRLVLLVILSYLFQLAVLYFSRSGISVLIHRIINPDLNGYFTEAIRIKDLGLFISGYEKNVLDFSMHATGHPPGAILFFWLIEKIITPLTYLKSLVVNLAPRHDDVLFIWNSLTLNQKTTAVFSGFFIPFLGSLNLIPLYLLAKKLFNKLTASRTVFLAIFLPALTLFTPLSDVFFPAFFLWSFLFFIQGIKNKNQLLVFLSGLVFSLGLFFSLTLLPLLLIYIYRLWKDKKYVAPFAAGLLIFYMVLYFFKYNFITVLFTLMTGLPKNRNYFPWVSYNLYDFFVFAGIPISFLYLKMFFKKIREPLYIAFTLMLFILNFSGAVRGEVGRIWLPLMFPLTIVVSSFITDKLKLKTKCFLMIVLLQAVQVLVLTEFWVTLW